MSSVGLAPARDDQEVATVRPGRMVLGWVGAALRRPTLVLAALVIVTIVAWAVMPGFFTGFDPIHADVSSLLQAPSAAHLFGTDELGRDVFTRMVYGTGRSLVAPLIAVAIGVVGGSVIGLIAGYLGRMADALVMRIVDVILAVPMLVLAMTIVTALGFGSVQLAVGVGIGMIASVARVMRSEVMRVRHSVFIDAERSLGARTWYILLRHVLPSAAGPVMVLAVLDFVQAILAIAALSFLGFGAPPPSPEWGSIVSAGQPYLSTAWWISSLPGLTIAIFAVCVNRVARALQDRRAR